MSKGAYVKLDDSGLEEQLQKFANRLPGHAPLLGIAQDEVDQSAADSAMFAYSRSAIAIMDGKKQDWTGFKNLLRDGPDDGAVVPVPQGVTVGNPPLTVRAGIVTRFRALSQKIKTHQNYEPNIGEDLGIEGPEEAAPDLATVRPEFTLLISGGQVLVKWSWNGLGKYVSAIEIEVDRGTGSGLLTIDTTPGYTDTTPHPATPAKWTYRAIWRIGETRVGQWSLPVSITVGG